MWTAPLKEIRMAPPGRMHFLISGYERMAYGENIQNWHISYVNCGQIAEGATINPANGIEIDHCYFYITDLNADHVISAHFSGSTWDENSIHHCTIYAPNTTTGLGPDFFQGNGSGGFRFYSNIFIGYLASYSGSQHQDGWQGLGNSSYIKIHDNLFVDMANYPIFGDAYIGGFSHVRVYNNTCYLSYAAMAAGNAPQAGGLGVDSGYIGAQPCVFDDVIVSNNIAVDYKNHLTFGLGNITANLAVFTNCFVVNNVSLNSGNINTPNAGNTVGQNNISLTREQGAANFVSYVEFGGLNNDLRPTSALLNALSAGSNLQVNLNPGNSVAPVNAAPAQPVSPTPVGSSSSTTPSSVPSSPAPSDTTPTTPSTPPSNSASPQGPKRTTGPG